MIEAGSDADEPSTTLARPGGGAFSPCRRDMLRVIACLGMAAIAFPPGAAAAGRGAGGPTIPSALAELFGDPGPMRLLGMLYLRDHTGEADQRQISECLFKGAVPADAAELARRFAAGRDRDLAAGDVALVDGWLLTRSEARLCALVALTAASL